MKVQKLKNWQTGFLESQSSIFLIGIQTNQINMFCFNDLKNMVFGVICLPFFFFYPIISNLFTAYL